MKQATNEIARIRQGLSQYVGALAVGIQGDSEEKKQLITAALLEEALGVIKEANDASNMYAAKPILRAALFVIKEYSNGLRTAAQMTGIDAYDKIQRNDICIKTIENIIDNAKKMGELV